MSFTRHRVVTQEWPRAPNGRYLEKPPPEGQRPPNGIIWGHTLRDFFWISRFPDMTLLTIWTRSMIREFGENWVITADPPQPPPRPLLPWPLLQLPSGEGLATINEIDEDCNVRLLGVPYVTRAANAFAQSGKAVIHEHTIYSSHGTPLNKTADVNQPGENTQKDISWVADTVQESLAKPKTSPSSDSEMLKFTPMDVSEPPNTDNNNNEYNGVETKATKPQVPKKPVHISSLPKLEEFIPEEYFPDILIVVDPKLRVGKRESSNKEAGRTWSPRPVRYQRVWPQFARDIGMPTTSPRVAHLDLDAAPLLGKGSHSWVYRAPLTLPAPLSARSPDGRVTVAAKTSNWPYQDRQQLKNEARIYNTFPKHMMEGWSGYHLVAPIRHPVPAGAVVPKFYGYYEPVYEEDRWEQEQERIEAEQRSQKGKQDEVGVAEANGTTASDDDDQGRNGRDHRSDIVSVAGLSPILLMEECGQQIRPESLSVDDKSECYSLFLRMHLANYNHNSSYQRNIMWQPGPLTLPPEQRSMDTPNFRIIDFGRTRHIDSYEHSGSQWNNDQAEEIKRLRRELQLGIGDC